MRIAVAMSGGVDSSVAALIAAQSGAEVIGVTLQLYDHGEAAKRSGACCAGQDIYDAAQVCEKLGVAHYVLDYESRFREGVIERFADDYARGRTPVPCSLCNQGVKFTDLHSFARELQADALVTGHPLASHTGPQLLPKLFNHDQEGCLRSLAALGLLDTEILLPGHGPVWRGSIREAAEKARAQASAG